MNHFVLLSRPTIRQLEYAAAVAEHRHFSRAATACDVSQPALSAQILALEEQLGVTLFERSRRGVLPTPEGQRLLPLIAATLRAADALVETAKESRDPFAGDLRLGVLPTIAPYLLPQAMSALRAEFPNLRPLPYEERTDTLLEMLRAGALDAAWLALPVDGDDLVAQSLYDEPFVVALRRDDPLARKESLRLDELSSARVLLLDDGHCLRSQALAVCERAGAETASELRATSLSTLVQMVASGAGITLLPVLAASVLMAGNELVTRPFRGKPPGREIGLVFRRNSPRSARLRRIGEVLGTAARKKIRPPPR